MTPDGILESVVYADDLDAAERFYSHVLELPVVSREPGRHVFFRSGASMFLVFRPDVTASRVVLPGNVAVPAHGARGPGHVAFRVHEAELPGWRDRLKAEGVPVEAEVAWPRGGRSLYFRDPAGNSIELATPALWGMTEE